MHTAFDALRSEAGLVGFLELLNRPAWHADAACREHPELAWVPENRARASAQRAVCRRCLVRVDCLTWALDQGPALYGIWGGTTQADRLRIARKRRKASTPREDPEAA